MKALFLATVVLVCALYTMPASSAAADTVADGRRVKVQKSCSWPDFDAAVQRFSRIIQFPSVSDASAPNHARNTTIFKELKAWLPEAYPSVWSALEVENVGPDGLSTLLTWRGSDPSLRPVMMVSHIDVVPVPEGSVADWTYPPFSGAVADGFVWGRGTMDVKVTVVAALEAVSQLLAKGWSPQRTLLFAFGHDEEVGGGMGAAATAKLLESRGVELEVIWDEGSAIMSDGVKPITKRPVALVATSEKGYVTIKAHITSRGGHSSMPPIDGSSVGDIMGRLLTRLTSSPPAPKLVPPVTDMLRGLAPYAPAALSALLAAIGRIPGVDVLVAGVMASASAESAALGELSINMRLLPGDTVESALAYIQGLIPSRDHPFVTLKVDKRTVQQAAKVTPTDSPWFQLLKQAIQEVWEADGEPLVVLPFLMPGGTDSSNYVSINRGGVLRFCPRQTSDDDVGRIHGTNERSALEDYRGALCTYHTALKLLGGEPAPTAAGAGHGSVGIKKVTGASPLATGRRSGGAWLRSGPVPGHVSLSVE